MYSHTVVGLVSYRNVCLVLPFDPLSSWPFFSPSPFPPQIPSLSEQARFLAQPIAVPMRTTTHAGTPIILAPRLPPPTVVATSHQPSINGAPPPLVSPPGEAAGLVYNPYAAMSPAVGSAVGSAVPSPVDPYGFGTATPSIFEYQAHLDQAQAGMFVRRDFVTGM